MKLLFGLPLRTPSFNEFTAASVMAVGLWLGALGIQQRLLAMPSAFDAGAMLIVLEWGCVAARMGIRPDAGLRHWAANIAVSAVMLGAYSGAWSVLG